VTPFLPPGSPGAAAAENRFGFDGKWDLGVGVWFETSFTHTDSPSVRRRWQPSWTVGADYTFAVGNGLTPVMDPLAASPVPVEPVPEDRFGLDGKWDLGVGVWLEGALVHQQTTLLPLPYQLSLTAGLDYTFGLGRGLNVLFEHFRLESSAAAFAAGQAQSVSALLVRYPLGLSDELTAIFYYDWKGDELYKFLSWKRTSDSLSFSAILFWNPEAPLLYPGQPGSSSFAGTGLQLVLGYDF
jgi:hypothetical protein